jgi:NAD(P)-dependent dehydrogenase (short-subunit alcohol dehydrogenase family)
MSMAGYQGKVALVTGAASGIGAALVDRLRAAGATVVGADLKADGEIRALNVTDAEAFQALVDDTVKRHGRIDLLFNNAGIGLAGEVRDLSLEDWRRVVEVNLMGVVHGVHAAYPHMVRQGSGALVNTASGAGLLPRPGMVPYAASKGAVVALSQSLREEAALYGVSVHAVCPGFIRTAMVATTDYRGLDKDRLLSRVPGRGMSAHRCADIILSRVRRKKPLIIIGPVLNLEWLIARLSPALALLLARFRARAFQNSRTGS